MKSFFERHPNGVKKYLYASAAVVAIIFALFFYASKSNGDQFFVSFLVALVVSIGVAGMAAVAGIILVSIVSIAEKASEKIYHRPSEYQKEKHFSDDASRTVKNRIDSLSSENIAAPEPTENSIKQNLFEQTPKKKRKGTMETCKETLDRISDIRALKNYVIVDIETTGLRRDRDKIIEIGIMKIAQGEIADTFETTINPGIHISAEASRVNGIYDEDIKDSPQFEAVAGRIWEMMSDQLIIAYNASFDIAFISRALEKAGIFGTIRYADALSVARRAYPGFENYKLSTVANNLEYPEEQTHRAFADVEMTHFVFEKSLRKIVSDHEEALRRSKEQKEEAARLRAQRFENSPLLNKTIAFTGEFQMDREQLENMVDSVGAILKNDIIKKLDYLVVGDLENLPEWALGRKIQKADRYISEGCPIQKITEGEYLRIIGESLNALKK